MSDYNLGTARGVIEIEYKGDGATKAQQDLAKTSDTAKKSGPTLDGMSRKAGLAGLTIAGGFALAAKSAGDFEARMSAISAVSGASAGDLEDLRNKALQLGKDTSFSAGESASAIEELVKAGLSVKDVLNGAADATVNLAAAGEVSMPEAATIASNAMNQFGLAAKDMVGVVDNIAGASNASAIDVSDFGQSLSQVGAVANLAGVNFEDTATAIALMGNAGIKGSDAGTSLKTMFQNLQPTTQKQMDTMVSLGLITGNLSAANQFLQKQGLGTAKTMDEATTKFQSLAQEMGKGTVGTVKNAQAAQDLMLKYGGLSNQFYDAKGNTKSLSDVSGALQKSLKGMTAQQKQATLQTLFGSDAIRAAAILADNGSKGFDKMAASMGKVSAADVAAKRLDNFKGSMEALKGSVETLGITVGTMLLPALRQVVDGLAAAANWFLNLDPAVQKGIVAFVGIVGATLLALAAFVKIVRGIQAVRAAFIAMRAVAIPAWLAALGPAALIVVAIAAVVAIIVLLWKKSETFRDIVIGVWKAVKGAVLSVVDWFRGVPGMFNTALDAVKGAFSAVVNFIRNHWRLIISIVLGPLGVVIALVTKFWPQIKAVFQAGIDFLLSIWQAFWNTFGGLITAAFGLVKAIILLGWTIIKGIFLLQLNAIRAIFTAVWNAIVAVLTAVWNVIKTVVMAGVNFVKGVIARYFNIIRAVTSAVWNGIKAVISAVWGAIGGTVMSAVNRVRSVIASVWGAIRSITSSMWNGIKQVVSSAVTGLISIVSGIKDKVMGALSGAASWLYDKGKEIIQGLIDGITAMIGKVTDAITGVTDKIAGFLPGSPVREGPLKVLNRGYTGGKITEMVADGITDNRDTLQRAINTVISVPDLSSDFAWMSAAAQTDIPATTGVPGLAPAGVTAAPAPTSTRIVSGELDITPQGKAYIRGQASDVYENNSRFAAAHGRMNG